MDAYTFILEFYMFVHSPISMKHPHSQLFMYILMLRSQRSFHCTRDIEYFPVNVYRAGQTRQARVKQLGFVSFLSLSFEGTYFPTVINDISRRGNLKI